MTIGTKVPRKASRDQRRRQLIEATISILAERGFAATTLTEVAVRAGVSHGMVNFHFQTKRNLLRETLAFLAEEYRQNWRQAHDAAGGDAAQRLYAMLCADFEPSICTGDRLSAWCAFWGEAQGKPLYQDTCGANDADYTRVQESICAELVAQGGYGCRPEVVALALRTMIQGLWLEIMGEDGALSPDDARASLRATLAAFFPHHFDAAGPRRAEFAQP